MADTIPRSLLPPGLKSLLRLFVRTYISHPGSGCTLDECAQHFAPDQLDGSADPEGSSRAQARLALWFLQTQGLVAKRTDKTPHYFVPVSEKGQTVADLLPEIKPRPSRPRLSKSACHVLYRLLREQPLRINFIDPSYGATFNQTLEHQLYVEGLVTKQVEGCVSLTPYGTSIAKDLPDDYATPPKPRGKRRSHGRTPAQISKDWREQQKKVLDHKCRQDICPKIKPLFDKFGPESLRRAVRILDKEKKEKEQEKAKIREALNS